MLSRIKSHAKRGKIVQALFFFLLLTQINFAQWVQTNGPFGGNAFPIVSRKYLFAFNSNGCFLSSNYGESWMQTINKGLPKSPGDTSKYDYIFSHAISDTDLVIGTDLTGIYISRNNGTSWEPINEGLPKLPWDTALYDEINSLAVSDTNLFAGTLGSGVFRSTNNGKSWMQVSKGLPKESFDTNYFRIDCFAISSNDSGGINIFASVDERGVYLSTDFGNNWISVNEGLPRNPIITSSYVSIQCLVISTDGLGSTSIFAGTDGAGVFHSTDNGSSWISVSEGLPKYYFNQRYYSNIQSLIIYPTETGDKNLYAGTFDDGVYRSTDNGSSWTQAGLTNTNAGNFAINGTNLFVGTNAGIFRSTNNGTSWSAVNSGLMNSDVGVFTASDTNLFAGTYKSGFYLSTNNGNNWNAVSPGRIMNTALAITGTYIFAGTSIKGIYRSIDMGTSWIQINNGLPRYPPPDTNAFDGINCFAISADGSDVFAGTDGSGVFCSTDNGNSWTSVSDGLPPLRYGNYDDILCLAISPYNSDSTNLFAGTSNSGVFLSTNNGMNWAAANDGLPKNPYPGLSIDTISYDGIQCLAISINGAGGTNLFAGTSNNGIYLSTNNGASWTSVSDGLPKNPNRSSSYDGIIRFAVYSNEKSNLNLFAGTKHNGIFLSTNNGTNWLNVNTGLTDLNTPVISVGALTVSNDYLYASIFSDTVHNISRGVWRRPLSDMITSANEKSDKIPRNFTLFQNYPNPFNPTTTLSFVISHQSLVSLKVYNILGEEVAAIVNKELPAGNYKYQWNAGNLASGIYFYRLRAGNFVDTKKLILIK